MSPEAHAVDEMLAHLPWQDRTTLLACAIITDCRAADSLLDLIGVIAILARRLAPADQLAIKWELANAAEELRAPWN